jgi:hypothetical protein
MPRGESKVGQTHFRLSRRLWADSRLLDSRLLVSYYEDNIPLVAELDCIQWQVCPALPARREWRTRSGLILQTSSAGNRAPFQVVSYRPDSDSEMGWMWLELVAEGDC